MQTETTVNLTSKDTAFGFAIYRIVNRAERAVADAREDIAKNGLAQGLKWSMLNGIVAETAIQGYRQIALAAQGGDPEEVAQVLDRVETEALQEMRYFDPTSGSSSIGANVASGAQFQGYRQVVEEIASLRTSLAATVQEAARPTR